MRRSVWCVLGVTALVLPAWCGVQYTIATVAGNGTSGFSGDGAAATSAQLNIPCAVVLDPSGKLYIADNLNSRVRAVAADGTITTIAGTGTAGYSGDSGAAISAQLNHPCGLALDKSGNLYVADAGSSVIRKIATGGTITTVAGNATAAYAGDGGPANQASLNTPIGIAFDSGGNLYIADSGNQRVRRMATDGTISTVAGDGFTGRSGDGGAATDAQLNSPQAVALDAAGNLYIADTNNAAIRQVSPDGTITTVAGTGTNGYSGDGGQATHASLNYPKGVAVDAAGNLYVADTFNSRVRVMAHDGTITTVAGTGKFGDWGDGGPATSALLKFPIGLALDAASNVYFADSQNSRIKRLAPVAPSIGAGGVITATAFGAFTSIAPGSWIEIYGSGLAAGSRLWSTADFSGVNAPTSLAGTSVTIGGQPAFISYVSPTQVNAQVPSNLAAGAQQITVTTASGTSAAYTATVNPTQPGLYAPPSFNIGGKQYAGAQFPDGATYALPSGAVQGIASRPARSGETITFYGVGFGPVTPATDAGQIVQNNTALASPLHIFFGPAEATVTYAGLAPGAVGLYQFNVVVPSVASSDPQPLTFTLGGAGGQQTLYVAVQP